MYIKILKKSILVFLAFFLVFCEMYSAAQNYGEFSIDLPQDFYYADEYADKTKISEITGVSVTELEEHYKQNNIKLFALDKENKVQIKISSFADDFSSKTVDFSKYNDEQLKDIAKNILNNEQALNLKIVSSNNHKFLTAKEAHKDSGGEYTVTQYITVVNGKNYSLTVFAPIDYSSDYADEIFESFKLESKVIKAEKKIHLSDVIILLLIISFAIIATISLISIIISSKAKNEAQTTQV